MNSDNRIPDFGDFPVFNQQNMERLRSQTANKPELLKEIIDSFLEESFEIVDDIKNFSENNKLEELSMSVHTLKGLTGTIGASRLYQILSYVDAHHKQNNFKFQDSLFDVFHSNLEDLKLYFIKEGFC